MSSMGQAAESGNEGLHLDTTGDTDWATYQPPGNSWDLGTGLNLLGIARQARQAIAVAAPEAPELTPEQEAEARKKARASIGIFWDDGAHAAPRRRKVTTLRPPTPAPLDWPPGFAGEIARYMHGAALRPVKEVAVVGTLGLLAGICGRQWHIPESGLNLYLVLVARSAIGKEAMHSGISKIVATCRKMDPHIRECADFTEYASGPALIKALVNNPCFVNVSGELGRKFKQLAEDSRNGPLQSLRTQWTNLYAKSAPTSVAGGLSYSATDNNVESIFGASYSLVGETTPGTFLESLTTGMMEDGFMSRFTIIEYSGERPPKNLSPAKEPPHQLVQSVLNLMSMSSLMEQRDLYHLVQRTPAAAVELELFDADVCDPLIEACGSDESRRQMWNRAGLKVLRIAALLAVADSYGTRAPLITLAHARWAINLVLRDTAAFTKRLDGGDVGSGDDARERKLVGMLTEYLLNEVPESYKVPDSMRQNSIVPRNYLQVRTAKAAAFYNHKLGATRALEECIASMIGNGYLMEVAKDKVVDAYGFHGKAFRVIRLPDYDHMN
ncbi:DUF3987 domain-containing protein [uncultured Aliiroseovarius sp.]|uniref:DUF3987 domain-containing protein n=1 Tax=uncultured Aliiroseovarius sp. TaxID=1658783 RepID=UPI00260BCFCC|nr:DUF3987 domain-containing protein [uncultured Aliiroseovarius sp.]